MNFKIVYSALSFLTLVFIFINKPYAQSNTEVITNINERILNRTKIISMGSSKGKRAYLSLQLRAKQTAPLVNKHYQNEVTLTGQNPPLKCCQPLEILTHFITGLDLSMIEIWCL